MEEERSRSTLALSPSTSSENIQFVRYRTRRRQVILIVLIVGIIAAVAGFLLGYFVKFEGKDEQGDSKANTKEPSKTIEAFSKFEQAVSTEELENNLRFFSQKPHFAGSERQHKLAEYLASKWREYGFDEVETLEYNVLLSYPMEKNPNSLWIVENGTIVEEIREQIEVSPDPGSNVTSLYTPYISYTPNGTAEGKLVYINRGTPTDFEELEKRNLTLNGTILLSRNFWGVRATALQAIKKGAKGVLLYPDPADVVKNAPGRNTTYPDGPWLSSKAVMEAQMYTKLGDPLTVGLPSLDGIYRRGIKDIKDIPPILVQPISFGDAQRLLQRMGGEEVPPDWRGGLNITYRFGPGFLKDSNGTVRLSVNNQLVNRSIYNVIGTILGREEPDRYVFLGNHRDAWFYGGADASTGSSVLTETARILSGMLKQSWRPRRTIKLCSFGGEEFGLIGSVEWMEENAKIFKDRGVAYVNTDVPVQGSFVLFAQTCPLLSDLILKWTKMITVPAGQGKSESMYDVMLKRIPSPVNPGEPMLSKFQFLSDYFPFYFTNGIPAADFSYFFYFKKGRWVLYPSYHTQEDTFYWVKKFADPRFEIHRAMTLLMGGMVLDLADARIIPFNVTRLKRSLFRAYDSLQAKKTELSSHGISTSQVARSLEEFSRSCDLFESHLNKIQNEIEVPSLTLRMLNDQLNKLEKAFIDPRLFNPNPALYKHVASLDNFNGVTEALAAAQTTNETAEIEKQLSIVSVAISSAAKILKPIQIP